MASKASPLYLVFALLCTDLSSVRPPSESCFLRVPYVRVLPEGLKDQTQITIRGEPKPNAEKFAIDICKGDDIAFHFNPRFNEDGKQVIVRTTRIRDVWGPEERELPFFPFSPGKPFEIKILCTSSGYRVEVNNEYLLHYSHRIKELHQITHIQIRQNVVLKHVHIESCFLRVPYVQVLPEGLKDQTQITISGEPKPNAEKFAIDICKGDNIAFHFNPRFNEDGNQVIVRTTRIEGVWGPEERELPFFPFSPGKPFEIKILCTSSGYRVEVNNEYLLHYSHRIKELHQITHIQIRQNVVLKHVHIDFTPQVPYLQDLPEGLTDNALITIRGEPKGNAERFDINIHKGDDIAFHFNPRFNEDGNQVIVRTTRIEGVWGPEERELPFFPFSPGKPFEIKIFCTSSDYRVEVDGKHLLNYGHRMKQLDQITHLYIQQDVVLKYIHIDFTLQVPYRQDLPEGLTDNALITIRGEPKANAERFAIDICKGDDVAFNFNPRFNEDGKQVIVRTTRIRDVWGPEERELPFFPFSPGKPFEIKIFCTSSDYRVEVDGKHLLNYGHRMKQLDQITHLYIQQDVVLKYVRIDFTLQVPYQQDLPEGLTDNALITIRGEPKGNAERFAIDICKGDDVAFNFNPRFNEDGKQVIVRTTRIRDVWGTEERELPFFPFSPGKPFEIKIFCTSSDYRVEVDGKHLLNYGHRMKQLDQITHLYIQQDVVLKYIHIEL
ncbi:uncharacterized protein LOC108416333 [Pygocentrus nattereri]|uniref:uncharacterized protein LOC108416333 n=1 Tax=Pygocentrus nattereri TaxID=42514 RepID=UPI0018912C02|nr:uncharacterized protein LOC108416333 [Pygocentrus nattereri]